MDAYNVRENDHENRKGHENGHFDSSNSQCRLVKYSATFPNNDMSHGYQTSQGQRKTL